MSSVRKAAEELLAAQNVSNVIGGREAAKDVQKARKALEAARKGGQR